MSEFPSLVIHPDHLVPRGTFAEQQARFLQPDPRRTEQLDALLERHRVGILAHFYMDAELQGLLFGLKWPHVSISDSLAMAGKGLQMVQAGVEKLVVLGVDFMSENVRAILDAHGMEHIPVYRAVTEPIGCTLAEAADSGSYQAYLERAARAEHPLHVIYINTSLAIKARAWHLLPTLTCTSSNAADTCLQAARQVPDVSLWFGPDTYMGRNLHHYFQSRRALATDPDERALLQGLLNRFHYFDDGMCVVHHLFGAKVARLVQEDHPRAHVLAHLEVPGEMFDLALAAMYEGRGVVGSTANILQHIRTTVSESTAGNLSYVLGTEAGMVTSIVRHVQDHLRAERDRGRDIPRVELVFPVAQDAVSPSEDPDLGVVPGAAGAEGCSTVGGCATCPYMKMNTLPALLALLESFHHAAPEDLRPFEPERYARTIAGQSIATLGTRPILHMQHYQQHSEFPQALVDRIRGT